LGLTLHGTVHPASAASASAIVSQMGVGFEPLARFRSALISALARITLASPVVGLFKMPINCVLVYVTLPNVSEFTGHRLGWFFQYPMPSGHLLPAVTVTLKLQLAVSPAWSVAVHVSVVVPIGNAEPDGMLHAVLTEQLS